MKRLMVTVLSVAFVMLVLVGNAGAYNFNISFTADDSINSFFYEDDSFGLVDLLDLAGISGDPDLSDFTTSTTLSLGVYHGGDIGYPFSLIWNVSNPDPQSASNPGGFLASFVDNSFSDPLYFSSGSMATSVEWNVSLDGIDWFSATTYGANSDSSTIWYTTNGGSISGISDDAQWIWWENNFGETGSPESLFIKVDVGGTIGAVPEPATMVLFGFGLVGFAGLAKRRIGK